ncbi:MAG TPA: DUF2007 domain-containing protein [Thermoanaerobaculia bacterium]|nr:DUF2007 domain-containing protein [Thermoanaerobaculia bacterium]
MKTVGNFPYLALAQLAQTVVEDEGIPALVPDQYIAGLEWRYTTAIGGVRLQVPPEHEEAARALLANPQPIDPADLDTIGKVDEESRCPSCGSEVIRPSRLRHGAKALTMLLSPVFLLLWPVLVLGSYRLHCMTCDHEW